MLLWKCHGGVFKTQHIYFFKHCPQAAGKQLGLERERERGRLSKHGAVSEKNTVRRRLKKSFNGFPKVARCVGIGHGSAPVPEIRLSSLSLGFGNVVFRGPFLFAWLCPTKAHFSIQDRHPACYCGLRVRKRCQGALKKTQGAGARSEGHDPSQRRDKQLQTEESEPQTARLSWSHRGETRWGESAGGFDSTQDQNWVLRLG